MANDNTSSSGIGTTLLLIAFIVLKLCHVIDWSWWWVLAPAWGPIGLVIIVYAIGAMFRKPKVVNNRGDIKSKWQERLDEMQARKKQMQK